MADDCKGSEEETGASRRNILEFLEGPAAGARRDILESGSHLDAEKIFRDGFIEVLGTTAIAETRLVLGLLVPLSTLSGKNATIAASSTFIRSMTSSLHPGSSTALTQPLIRLFADYVGRKPPLDPRYALLFLSEHGGPLINLAIEKHEVNALALVEALKGWIKDALTLWTGTAVDREEHVAGTNLVPRYCKTILQALSVSALGRDLC